MSDELARSAHKLLYDHITVTDFERIVTHDSWLEPPNNLNDEAFLCDTYIMWDVGKEQVMGSFEEMRPPETKMFYPPTGECPTCQHMWHVAEQMAMQREFVLRGD